jgi:nitroreductase
MPTILSAQSVNEIKKAPAIDGVLPIFHERWSPRSFADRDVNPDLLKKAFEAARWAASSFNEQPWRFLVGVRGTGTHAKILGSLGEFNQKWAQSAPVLILGVTKTKFSQSGKDNRVALYDLGAAASYLTLQAAALGLATHQMAGFDTEAARNSLGIPGEYAIGAVIALGYQGEPEALSDQNMLDQETKPRARKQLGEIVFSAWDEPARL